MSSEKFHIVTSFNEKGYEKYGKNFIESFKSKDVKVYIGTEDEINKFPQKSNITYFSISKNLSINLWEQYVSKLPEDLRKSYLFQAHRFCFKVLSLNANYILPNNGYRVWIDADVLFKKEINANDLLNICEKNYLTYLGRDSFWHSECGFIIFKLNNYGNLFLYRWLWYYTTARVILLPEWHDSFVFDVVRKEFSSKKIKNLSLNLDDRDVWDKTILNEYMVHLKGSMKNENFKIDK
jgi:hypothetical protein